MTVRDQLNSIIENYWTSGKFIAMTARLTFSSTPDTNSEMQKDFIGELMLSLLDSKDKKKLVEMHGRGELDFYIMRIISNQHGNKYSTWNRLCGNYEFGKISDVEFY